MPTYNCTKCGLKHNSNDACGRGERADKRNRNLRAPVAEFSRFDAVWS